jgi:drug/metabolite transporter (DMT)-like permease
VTGAIFLIIALQALYVIMATGAMAMLSSVIGVTTAVVPFGWAIGRGEHLSPLQWAGAVAAMTAVAVAGAVRNPDRSSQRQHKEVALAVAAGLSFGCTFVIAGSASGGSELAPVLWMRFAAAIFAA